LAARHGTLALRCVAACLVLVAEYLFISVLFDAETVVERGGAWELIGRVGSLATLAVVLVTATLILWPALDRGARSAAPPLAKPSPVLLGAHALLYVMVVYVVDAMFGRPEPPSGAPLLWMAAALTLLGAAFVALVMGLRVAAGFMQRTLPVLLFAAALVGGTAWLAGQWLFSMWDPLSRSMFFVVSRLLRAAFDDVTAEPETLTVGLDDFIVTIAPVCSGIEGAAVITVLLVSYLVAFRAVLKFPRALLLLPSAVAAVWFGNVLRIAALIVLGARVDPDLALGAFHSKAGWVFVCAIALGAAVLGRRLRFFARDVSAPGDAVENPTAAYLMPLLVLLGVALVTSAFTPGVDLGYPLRILGATLALWVYRPYYRELIVRPSAVAAALGAVVAVGWIASAPPDAEARGQVAAAFAEQPGWVFGVWLAFRVFGSLIVVPICEELAFRGYLLRWLVARDFSAVALRGWTIVALVGSSLAFGLLHERWLAATVAGACYAVAQIRSGRLADAALAHAVTNALIAVWIACTGDWSLWV
jgi:exosortase E/protease (VPEID-CTERM system)